MCTAVLSIEPGLPVLLAGVRDELTDRAWEPPGRHWPQYPGLTGGRDLQAGGTWLAVAQAGRRVACVLNGIGRPAPAAVRRSRGVLPLLAAAGEPHDRRMLAEFDPFLLVVAEPGAALVQSWDGRRLAERALPAGLHMIVNSGLASSGAASNGPGEDPPAADSPGTDLPAADPPAADLPGADLTAPLPAEHALDAPPPD